MVILKWLPAAFWVILWLYWFISAMFAKKSVHKGLWWLGAVRFRLAILVVFIAVVYFDHGQSFGYLWLRVFDHSGAASSNSLLTILLSVVGVIFCSAGVAFAIWARAYLGRNWGMPMSLREKPELVTSGPYKFVRHPIYSGFLVAMFGTALDDGIVWLVIVVVVGIYFIYSAKTEEKMMAEQFPDEYPAYIKRTKMLIPFVL